MCDLRGRARMQRRRDQFCNQCIAGWFEVGTRTCPSCRKRFASLRCSTITPVEVLAGDSLEQQALPQPRATSVKNLEMGFDQAAKTAATTGATTAAATAAAIAAPALLPSLVGCVWTEAEIATLWSEQARLGNKWAKIVSALPGRTANTCKCRFARLLAKSAKTQAAAPPPPPPPACQPGGNSIDGSLDGSGIESESEEQSEEDDDDVSQGSASEPTAASPPVALEQPGVIDLGSALDTEIKQNGGFRSFRRTRS